jgi:hypothetical protein
VFGKIQSGLIAQKAITLTLEKSQTMPVILFCEDLAACYVYGAQLPNSEIFAGSDAGALVALLD